VSKQPPRGPTCPTSLCFARLVFSAPSLRFCPLCCTHLVPDLSEWDGHLPIATAATAVTILSQRAPHALGKDAQPLKRRQPRLRINSTGQTPPNLLNARVRVVAPTTHSRGGHTPIKAPPSPSIPTRQQWTPIHTAKTSRRQRRRLRHCNPNNNSLFTPPLFVPLAAIKGGQRLLGRDIEYLNRHAQASTMHKQQPDSHTQGLTWTRLVCNPYYRLGLEYTSTH
jgi:hypothetical protein